MSTTLQWYALRSPHDLPAERALLSAGIDVYLPRHLTTAPDGSRRERPLIPHVLFIRTTPVNALALERHSHRAPSAGDLLLPPFWIYRLPADTDIRPVSPQSIHLLRLLTSAPDTQCEIYTRQDYRPGQHVRITGGIYAGYTGHIARVRKNRHVIVRLEGICLIMLPYIHPDLLEPLP